MADKSIKGTEYEKKELTFLTCPIHNIKYPKGASCPICKK